MLLPIGDAPNPRTTPWVTRGLIAVNVAVFLLVTLPLSGRHPDLSDPALIEYLRALGAVSPGDVRAVLAHLSAYDLFVFEYGFRPASPSIVSLFSAMFLHGGWAHLLGNMLFLWIFGDNVEHRLGPVRFLLAYLATGMAATLFFALFVPASQVPLVGASGAISGILGFYFIWFPRNQVKMLFFFFFLLHIIEVPARLVLGFYLVVDNLLPFLLNGSGSGGVAHGAHIGGFIAGMGLALWGDRLAPAWKVRRQTLRRDRPDSSVGQDEDSAGAIAKLLAAGERLAAAAVYLSLGERSRRRQIRSEDVLEMGEALLDAGRADEALSLFRRFISDRPGDERVSRAYLGAGRAMMLKPRCRTSAWHYFLAAVDSARSAEEAARARACLSRLRQEQPEE